MKLNYYSETDTLYINLSEQPSVENDADGRLVGIDIGNASHKVEMEKLILSKLPGRVEMVSACDCY